MGTTAVTTLELGRMAGPLLVFGGPYSNLQATQALREEAERLQIPPNQIICTGDVVAYCAQPQATVDLIREWGIHVVMGNCEDSLGFEAADCGCGFDSGSACDLASGQWYPFAQRNLNAAAKAWMRTLPREIGLSLGERRVRLLHGAPQQINRFVFASASEDELLQLLAQAEADVVIGGHCGMPFGRGLAGGHLAWLNAGVIGMPANDGTPDGWYLLLQTQATGLKAEWRRLPYDYRRAASELRECALLGGYEQALLSGRWPSMQVLPAAERRLCGIPLESFELVINHPSAVSASGC